MEIWALVIEDDEEQNIALFWRKEDVVEALRDYYFKEVLDHDTAVNAEEMLKKGLGHALGYISEATGNDWDAYEVPIEGVIDASVLMKVEKEAKKSAVPKLRIVAAV